jgi:dephospho-CoA kinase
MKILLFGDIAAGKTTVSYILKQQYSDFEIVAVDDFRRKLGDNTMKGEMNALKKFISHIEKDKNQIIEASGLGELGIDIFKKISKFNDVVLLVIFHIPMKEIKKRIENRIWNIPFPGKQEKLNEIVLTINSKIKAGEITTMWAELEKTTILKTENINKEDQEFIIKTITNFIYKHIK